MPYLKKHNAKIKIWQCQIDICNKFLENLFHKNKRPDLIKKITNKLIINTKWFNKNKNVQILKYYSAFANVFKLIFTLSLMVALSDPTP